MQELPEWIEHYAADRMPVFVGLNAAFDWAFVNYYYFLTFFGSNPFGFAPLDIKAYYAGTTGSDWRDARSSQMKQTLGATLQSTHEALDDARAQAELFRLVRDLIRSR